MFLPCTPYPTPHPLCIPTPVPPLQACRAAAAAIELAASDPLAYHNSSSSSYCHWLPQHAAVLLQSYLSLGYKPPGLLMTSVLTALMLHWEYQLTLQEDEQALGGVQLAVLGTEQTQLEDQQSALQPVQHMTSVVEQQIQQQQQQQQQVQQQGCQVEQQEGVSLTLQQLEQQVAAVQLLEVLANTQHQTDQPVSCRCRCFRWVRG